MYVKAHKLSCSKYAKKFVRKLCENFVWGQRSCRRIRRADQGLKKGSTKTKIPLLVDDQHICYLLVTTAYLLLPDSVVFLTHPLFYTMCVLIKIFHDSVVFFHFIILALFKPLHYLSSLCHHLFINLHRDWGCLCMCIHINACLCW